MHSLFNTDVNSLYSIQQNGLQRALMSNTGSLNLEHLQYILVKRLIKLYPHFMYTNLKDLTDIRTQPK